MSVLLNVKVGMEGKTVRAIFVATCAVGGAIAIAVMMNSGGSGTGANLPKAVLVTRTELGANWPFRGITSGLVGCDPQVSGAIVFTLTDGTGRVYALNGTALDAGYKQFPNSIWPQDGGTSISPVQDHAPANGCSF